jgi:hypothetical protein
MEAIVSVSDGMYDAKTRQLFNPVGETASVVNGVPVAVTREPVAERAMLV